MSNNKLIIFTGPSAVGKATIEKELFKNKNLKLALSVSATTRKPRQTETDGEHYTFISHEEFDQKIKNNEFLEWNEHFFNKYGTLYSEIKRIKSNGYNPFLEVEVIGAKNILEKYDPKHVVSIFIAPPSLEALMKRIKERGTETQAEIDSRLSRAKEELSYSDMFDYVVVNDDLTKTVKEVEEILLKEL